MSRFARRLIYALRLLEEWQALFLCFIAGAATCLAFAPFQCWWVLPLTLPIFYLLLNAAAGRRHALGRGFFFGYGYFMAGTWWIANALAVDMEKFGWLIPVSILGLSALFALWFALLGWLVWWRRTGNDFSDLLRFIVLWLVIEYLRSLGLFGFPWNLLGYATLASERVAQLGSIAGIYGLSLLTLMIALLPVVWLKQAISPTARSAYSALVLIALIVTYGYGMMRMPDHVTMGQTRIRIVQPNIEQSMKWTQEGRLESLRLHGGLSQMKTEASIPPLILWSETAMPFTLYPDGPWPSRLTELIPPGSTLITGAVRADDRKDDLRIWNSLIIVDSGQIQASYDKHQLVPFGEFVPLRHWLPIDKITPGSIDFSRGLGATTMHYATIPAFSPLICYEAIFPSIAVNPAERPAWLVNVTNDAWYGDTPGPYQHFAMSRLRAIEQGLPLARAANTGISAMVDPYGRIVRSLPLNERGFIDQAIPLPLPPTFYVNHGEIPLAIILAALWLLSLWSARVRKG